jgi:DNA-binding LytR/AlgR family response regulator
MNLLIIEDEPQAAQRLEKLLTALVPDGVVVGNLDSVKKAVDWFGKNPPPDVVLMDIQLADGLSFEIFEKCDVSAPVIFTTAYDEYALRAFKVNSIDYILKPVDKGELNAALKKLNTRVESKADTTQLLKAMNEAVKMLLKKYKTRFVVKVGEHIKTIEVGQVRFFYSQDKASFCFTNDNRNFLLDYTLEQIVEMVDPAQFFRINRKYLVGSAAIQDIITHTNSRLKLVLKGCTDNDSIVAREKVQEFREWLDK